MLGNCFHTVLEELREIIYNEIERLGDKMSQTYTMTKTQFIKNLRALRQPHGSVNLILAAAFTAMLFFISYAFSLWRFIILEYLLSFMVHGFSTVLWACCGLSIFATTAVILKRFIDYWYINSSSQCFRQGPHCFALTNEGLVVGPEQQPQNLTWSQIYRWDDAGDALIIYLSRKKMIMIPRKYAAKQYGLSRVLSALITHVGDPRIINPSFVKD